MPKARKLVDGSVVKLGGRLVVILGGTEVVACRVENGVVVPESDLDSDDHFAEIISHDLTNLKLNLESITRVVEEEIGGEVWLVRKTYGAHGQVVSIPLSTKADADAKAAAAAEASEAEARESFESIHSTPPAPPEEQPAVLGDTASAGNTPESEPEPQLAPGPDEEDEKAS